MFCLLVEAVRVEVVEDSAVVGVYLGGPEDVSRGRGWECLTDRPTVLSASSLPYSFALPLSHSAALPRFPRTEMRTKGRSLSHSTLYFLPSSVATELHEVQAEIQRPNPDSVHFTQV